MNSHVCFGDLFILCLKGYDPCTYMAISLRNRKQFTCTVILWCSVEFLLLYMSLFSPAYISIPYATVSYATASHIYIPDLHASLRAIAIFPSSKINCYWPHARLCVIMIFWCGQSKIIIPLDRNYAMLFVNQIVVAAILGDLTPSFSYISHLSLVNGYVGLVMSLYLEASTSRTRQNVPVFSSPVWRSQMRAQSHFNVRHICWPLLCRLCPRFNQWLSFLRHLPCRLSLAART